jgi:hypothetical protein
MRRGSAYFLATAVALVTAPAAPATSPGREGRIAFQQVGHGAENQLLVTSRPNGTDVTPISDRLGATLPRWSADGTLVAYSSSEGVFIARADGSEPRTVSGIPGPFALSPARS